MSTYPFQIYEAVDELRKVEENLKFASEYRGFSNELDKPLDRTKALKACYDHRRYLMEKFRTAVEMDK